MTTMMYLDYRDKTILASFVKKNYSG